MPTTTDEVSPTPDATPRQPLARGEALHVQIARQVRNDIAAGRLRDGTVLPATRALATEWGVSVFTITEAMKLLAAEGVVISESRSKRVVRAPDHVRSEPVRHRTTHAVLVGGHAGSGKSEFSRIIARETGWPLLDKDTLTRPVVERALEALGLSPNDRESDGYRSEIRPREYEALAAATRENLQCGNSVIATAPFLLEFGDEAWLTRTADEYESLGATLDVVWLYCDPRTMYTYLRRRGAARDAAKLTDWQDYVTGIDTDFRPKVPHTVVENCSDSPPLQEQAKALLGRLDAG
jgi:DNA-binding transcriptional regulator YhcF (GntR family)